MKVQLWHFKKRYLLKPRSLTLISSKESVSEFEQFGPAVSQTPEYNLEFR